MYQGAAKSASGARRAAARARVVFWRHNIHRATANGSGATNRRYAFASSPAASAAPMIRESRAEPLREKRIVDHSRYPHARIASQSFATWQMVAKSIWAEKIENRTAAVCRS